VEVDLMRKLWASPGSGRTGGISGARRVVAVAGVAIAGVVAVGAPAAQAAAQVDTFPVTWTLTSEVCPNLPAGTTITASGVETSVTSSPARPGGFLVNATHAQGTATDQDGNVYVFIYSNEFRVTPRADGSFVGLMTDHFSLSGAGPATLSNGFVAHITTDFATFFSFDPISAHGNPITFPEGEEVCDPL
jgi:hypothetical protein